MNDLLLVEAFRNSGVAVIILDSAGKILFSSQMADQLLGHPPPGLQGRHVEEILCFSALADLGRDDDLPAGQARLHGVRARDGAGNGLELQLEVTAWQDPAGQTCHTLILRNEATERALVLQLEQELSISKNALRGARIGVFEYRPSSDEVIVSDMWRELLELTPQDTIDVQVEWRSRVHPDDLAIALEPVRLCQEGLADRAGCEYRLLRRDGSHWQWIKTDISVAHRDAAGVPTRISGAMIDITEQKLTEQALLRSVEQFRSAFESATIGKAIVGLDGAFLRVNSALCDLLGFTPEEMLKTDLQTLTHPDDLADDINLLRQLVEGKVSSYQMEKRFLRSNGAIVWGNLSVALVRDAEGRPEQFIAQIVDATEQRRLNEIKSEFVATVSHELRTPLTSVLGALSLLTSMDTEALSDPAQRLLYIAQQNGNRLLTLVNDILDFERFSSKQVRFALTRQNIMPLIEEAVMASLAFADKYEVRMEILYPGQPIQGFVDAQRLGQVMANLLSNAAKFADRGTLVQIIGEDLGDVLRISVRNEGRGVPEAFRAQIFEPFSQADLSSTRTHGGTGLGLSITKQIVEQTGGKIGFESEAPGVTTFWFTIPKTDPKAV